MPRLQSPNDTAKGLWHEYGGWVLLMIAAYALWTFRKVFQTLGDTANAKLEAATAQGQAQAQTKADQTKVQVATGSSTKYTEAQIAIFRADANALAGFLKTSKDLSAWERYGISFANDTAAFSMLKQKYSRLRLINNKPIEWTGGKATDKNRPYKNVSKETPKSVTNPINWKVLIPFYEDATDKRNLLSDLRATLTGSSYKNVLPWVL